MAANIVKAVTATATAENMFTDWVSPTSQIPRSDKGHGRLNLSVSGTFVATVTLQRRFADDSVAKAVETYTAATEQTVVDYEPGVEYRVGVATGNFTSGSVSLRLSKQGVS